MLTHYSLRVYSHCSLALMDALRRALTFFFGLIKTNSYWIVCRYVAAWEALARSTRMKWKAKRKEGRMCCDDDKYILARWVQEILNFNSIDLYRSRLNSTKFITKNLWGSHHQNYRHHAQIFSNFFRDFQITSKINFPFAAQTQLFHSEFSLEKLHSNNFLHNFNELCDGIKR